MSRVTPQQQAIIDNDIEKIVANAVSPPTPKEVPLAEKIKSTTPAAPTTLSNDLEDTILDLSAYINETDSSMLKTIISSGHGEGFLVGSIVSKLVSKKELSREELLDVAHHMILLLQLNKNKE